MPRATNPDGSLATLTKCKIEIPTYPSGHNIINLKVLPEITDGKGANYTNEPIIGRTTPLLTYGYSEARTIGMDLHFIVTNNQDIADNLKYMRIIESLVYPGPRTGPAPYQPPPVCHITCGQLLGQLGVCAVLRNYQKRFLTDVAWDEETYLPYKFSVSTTWEVVYACMNLPTNNIVRVCGGTCDPLLPDYGSVV